MVTQAQLPRTTENQVEPSTGSIRHMANRIRKQWSQDEMQDRRHQAYLFQQQLLQACGLVSNEGLEDVITVAQ